MISTIIHWILFAFCIFNWMARHWQTRFEMKQDKKKCDKNSQRENEHAFILWYSFKLCIIFSNMSAVFVRNAWAGFWTSGDITVIYVATRPKLLIGMFTFILTIYHRFEMANRWDFLEQIVNGNVPLRILLGISSFPSFTYDIMLHSFCSSIVHITICLDGSCRQLCLFLCPIIMTEWFNHVHFNQLI